MKTVSGVVLSSKPVSLSKAAKILSKFASADNGASPAYVHYLKRASNSFDEAVQVHKELRVSGPERKNKKNRSSIRDEAQEAVNSVRNCTEAEVKENGIADGERHELVLDERDEVKEPKKKKKKEGKKSKKDLREDGRSDDTVGVSKESIHVVNGVSIGEKIEYNLKNEKMINGSEEIADVRDGQREKKVSKKRKSDEIGSDNGEVNDSAEKKMQKKKRKKGKSEVGY